MAKITDIEGIGPASAGRLAALGITTTGALLRAGGSRTDRRNLASASGLTERQILGWCNRADLLRVRGVGEEYSDLLEAAGVDTCKELATRRPDNLHSKMSEVNASKRLVRRPPGLSEVERWVAHAKTLDPVLTH